MRISLKLALVTPALLALDGPCAREPGAPAAAVATPTGPSAAPGELVVRVLDVGQGDATVITNGSNVVVVDGGPDMVEFAAHLDRLGLGRDTTIDVVVLSHQHADHYMGLRELFRSSRRLRVRYVFENQDVSPNRTLRVLRDSVIARARRGELVYRDTDDPCGDGRTVCTITLNGGAKLHVLRPDSTADDANNRSTPLKLVGPDSASFTMWMAGDAEHEAIRWFNVAGYGMRPGLRANVLKADHHGSCNGVTSTYLARVRPAWAIVSLGARNPYGHMHAQAKTVYRSAGVPWYRTDRNGSVTIRSPGTPGGGFSLVPDRPGASLDGASDRASTADECSR
jgi:competence protein ComEC